MSRLYALDILRIICSLAIFVFHSVINMGCSYGPFQLFFEQGAVFMVMFFMLSGFVMHMQCHKKDMMNISNMKTYYIKRLGALYPLYLVMVFLYEVVAHKTPLKDFIVLLPIETLLLQSHVSGLFSYTHNGGTWFVSCMTFCIFLSPFFCSIIKSIERKTKLLLLLFLSFISIYTPLVVAYFRLPQIYSSTVFRSLEFFIGAIIADLYLHSWNIRDSKNWKNIGKGLSAVAWIFLFLSISFLTSKGIAGSREYNFISIPVFALILYLTPFSWPISLSEAASRVLGYINSLCYPFFMAQFFTWRLTRVLGPAIFKSGYYGPNSNIIRILLSFAICVLVSVVFNELICKPCSKLIGKSLS